MTKNKSLITGASSGIGATYADRLAAQGHDLVLVARDKMRLHALAQRLSSRYGIEAEALPADLLSTSDLNRIEARLREDPSITMLVNSAGMAGGGVVACADPDRLETIIRLNVVALTRLSAAAAAAFSARKAGVIVNLGSVTALMAESFEPTYLASKAYVLAFSQALRQELGPKGVTVQVVLPGVTRTEIWAKSGNDIAALPQEMVMEVGDLVDAALAGLALGEPVTIPSLPDLSNWERLEEARLGLGPNLSRSAPADRYRVAALAEA